MHTTNLALGVRRGLRRPLVDIPLPLDFFPADAMRFIPVQLRLAHRSAFESYQRYALHFTPPARAIESPKPLEIPDTPADGDRVDASDLSDNLEKHRPRFSTERCRLSM